MLMRNRPAPGTVRVAAMLLFAVVAVQVLRAVLTFAMFDTLIDAYAENSGDAGLPRDLIEDRAPRYKEITLINAVVIGGLLALCGVHVLRGARWARVTATVVGALGVCGGALTVLDQLTPLFTVLGVLVAVGLGAAIVLLWWKPSSEYFRAPPWAGGGQRSAASS